MTFPITKTADHSVSVGSLLSTTSGGEHVFPTYLVTSDATAIGAANALYVQPGTGATWAVSDGGGSITVDGSVSVSGSVAVTDNSGSLTVDAPVGTPVFVRLSDGTSAISTLPVSIASAVAVTDNSGSLTVDAPVGTPVFVRLSDGTSAISTLPVSVAAAVAVTDNSGSLTVDAPVGTPVFVRLSDGTAAISTLPVSLASAVAVTDNSGSLTVDNAGTFAVQAAQSGTWTVGLSSGTNGIGKLTANSGVTIGAVEIAASQTLSTVTTVTTVTTVSTLTGGGVAHDGVDSGNPVKIGGKAVSSQSGQTAVASGDRSDLIQDLDGTVISRNVPHGDIVTGTASTTGTSDTSVVAAQGVGTYTYVDCITVVNTGSTTALITFKDGSGGGALWYAIAPAGGGIVISKGGKPIFRTSANTALHFAAGSASTTIYVSISGYKSKV